MVKIPKPTLSILKLLRDQDLLTPTQIQRSLPMYQAKDIKYAIRRLREKGIIVKIPDLTDMRKVMYRIATIDEYNYEKLRPQELEFYKPIIENNYNQEIAVSV